MKIATFDLDSTLADTQHRYHLIDQADRANMDWVAYSKACVEDPVLEGMAAVVRLCLALGVEVHYVTGRMDAARPETMAWLVRELGDRGPFLSGRLHMDDTASGDHVTEFGSHAAYKVARVLEVIEDAKRRWSERNLEYLFHVDDYPEVAVLLAEKGVPCIPVRAPHELLTTKIELT